MTNNENEMLKMICRLEHALIVQAAITNKALAGAPLDRVTDQEMTDAELDLVGVDGITVGQTVLEASRILRAKLAHDWKNSRRPQQGPRA
jgi:hypothetical protein